MIVVISIHEKGRNIMNDQIGLIAILGMSYLLLNQGSNTGIETYTRGEQDANYKTFRSPLYDVTFKYPADWTKNPNYEERYDGPSGFFEVSELESFGRSIDQVTKQEIDIPIKPYGTRPEVISTELDGEPARIIMPSSDQQKVFDREVAIIVKNKRPVSEGSDIYDYTVIWTNRDNLQTILDSFKFL